MIVLELVKKLKIRFVESSERELFRVGWKIYSMNIILNQWLLHD